MSALALQPPAYQASRTKRRRASKAEMAERYDRIIEIVDEIAPATVRQVYYQATVRGLIDKTEAGYDKIQRPLVRLRRGGRVAYGSIVDNTRWMRKPDTYGGLQEALAETARLYRRDLWRDANAYVEVWVEKDALAGVIYPITDQFDVPLMVSRGFSSITFLQSAGEDIGELEVPAYIYHLGDFDPSGVAAAKKIEEGLREFAPDAEIHFERLAVTEAQIEAWNLPTRPTKASDTRSRGFGAVSVELDAIEPNRLRALVERAIARHVDPHQLEILKRIEAEEREQLRLFAVGGRR